MTRAAAATLLLVLMGGCTPALSRSPGSSADDDDVTGDDADAVGPSIGCYTVGEDFWNDGYAIYRVNVEDGTAAYVVGPLDVEPSLVPSAAVVGGAFVGYDAYDDRILSIDLASGAVSFSSAGLGGDEASVGPVDLDGGLLLPVEVGIGWSELRLYASAGSMDGAADSVWSVQSEPSAWATDGDELVGLVGDALLAWRLGGATPQALDSVTLPDLEGGLDGLELLGDEVVAVVRDEIWRFDRQTGDLTAAPLEIRAPGDAWAFRGLVCVEE